MEDKLKMAVGREGNPEISRYLSKNTKTGDFKQQRTLSGSFFVIPEHLGSIRAVVLAFTANKQTNKHSQLYILAETARLWQASTVMAHC